MLKTILNPLLWYLPFQIIIAFHLYLPQKDFLSCLVRSERQAVRHWFRLGGRVSIQNNLQVIISKFLLSTESRPLFKSFTCIASSRTKAVNGSTVFFTSFFSFAQIVNEQHIVLQVDLFYLLPFLFPLPQEGINEHWIQN